MSPGDAVVMISDPFLHGCGLFDCCLPDGRVLVVFIGEREEVFEPIELELLDIWIEQQMRDLGTARVL